MTNGKSIPAEQLSGQSGFIQYNSLSSQLALLLSLWIRASGGISPLEKAAISVRRSVSIERVGHLSHQRVCCAAARCAHCVPVSLVLTCLFWLFKVSTGGHCNNTLANEVDRAQRSGEGVG